MTASFLPANTTAAPAWLACRAEMVARAQALLPGLRARAGEADATRTIPAATIREFHETELFRVLQPARWGGAELDFGIYVEIGAILATACASSSWVWANLVSHHWMLAWWPEAAQRELWEADRDMLIGSAFVFPCGRASRVDGGYRLQGRWPFSSGIDHCSWLMVGGQVAPPADAPPGTPSELRMFLVPPGSYQVIDTWHVAGLRGTGSRDVAIAEAIVPEHRTVAVTGTRDATSPGCAVNTAPTFRVPMFATFPYAISGTVLGIAEGAVAQFTEALKTKTATYTGARIAELAPLQLKVAEAAVCCDAARALLAKDCAEITEYAERSHASDMTRRAIYRRNPAFAAELCVRAVDLLFTASGGGGIYDASPIQRAWRDIHAATAHISLVWDAAASIYGRVALGLPADNPTI
jgi:3-hydroxy-9,10-secoandrosta-1,3,5(10)-triene-9,17-dione monooxygenase